MDAIYGREGEVVGWREGANLYDLGGTALALIDGEAVHSFDGGHVVGWFLDRNYRDRDGNVVAFEEGATGGPLKPLRHLRPFAPLRGLLPLRPLLALKPLRPLWTLDWSRHEWNTWIKT
jgi:hypothetical protein